MGDISRHRDIFLFTQETVPTQLLDGVRLTRGDLTYLELGNYLTDVSQFRDPVTYIFAKRRIWNEKIIPETQDTLQLVRALEALAGAAALGASQYLKGLTSGTAADVIEGTGIGIAALAAVLAILPSDTYADLAGADNWIDALLGTPLERTPPVTASQALTPQAKKKRDIAHYGFLGEFFRLVIESATHALFADDVAKRARDDWGRVEPIPAARVSEVFEEFFTQYYPHEHTDQPPYVWDASKRPSRPAMYGPSRRQRTLADGDVGVMNAVDVHYVGYLAEGLSAVEQEWRALNRDDTVGRQRLLVRVGKLLHGVEDWFFHSNVVELIELRSFRPEQVEGQSDEAFLKLFVEDVATRRPEYVAADATERRRMKRRLYRRLRYPAYETGTKAQSAGRLSTSRDSTPSLRHAYPAFPSSQDTAHTLLHALENLEHKAAGSPDELPGWATSVLDRRGFTLPPAIATLARPAVMAAVDRELREWIPLVHTLLSESERQRLVANVAPEQWPLAPGAAPPRRTTKKTEIELQLARHVAALKPRETEPGRTENNYEQFARYLVERDHLNERGRAAMVAAFDIDRQAEALPTKAPGCGGFLMEFALEQQAQLDAGDAATQALNRTEDSVFGRASDNTAFNEIVGSHSLMSKDTLTSVPFFDDARVLASVASSSVFTILLRQIATPHADRRLAWEEVLHHVIRFPPRNGGWERRSLALFVEKGRTIPSFADLPELTLLADRSLRPAKPTPATPAPSAREDLEERYRRLELELARYRYP